MNIEINAALDGPYETIGKLIVEAGHEDSSGFRRAIVQALCDKNWDLIIGSLNITSKRAFELYEECEKAWGPAPK